MLIHHQQLNLDGDHLRPLSDEDAEFNFWSSGTDTWYYESPRPLTHVEVEQHTRSQIIADGRKQMMEMISSMPESSYELSLKDIVEDQGGQVKDELVYMKNKNNKKKRKIMGKEIVRISSMETEGLLIKSFFPTSSFSFKKRSEKVGACSWSKVVPDHSSSDQKPEIKKCWVDRIFKDRKDRSGGKGHSLRRWFKGDDILPSCWLLFHLKKFQNKSKQKEECVVNTVLKC